MADALADAARPIALRYFRGQNQDIENKDVGGFDPVTRADREIEQAMRSILADRRPNDAILGEEFGNTTGTSGFTWVLDPIDGTRGFMSGTPTWGVLVAVNDGDQPILGLIDQPYTGERFMGGLGRQELLHRKMRTPLQTKSTNSLSDATIFTTFPEVGSTADGNGFDALADQCKLTRYGMDCYAYALLAAGQIDLVVEAALNPYDIQAPIAVVHSAGGIVTDWKGGTAQNGGRAIAAANANIHTKALEILSKF